MTARLGASESFLSKLRDTSSEQTMTNCAPHRLKSSEMTPPFFQRYMRRSQRWATPAIAVLWLGALAVLIWAGSLLPGVPGGFCRELISVVPPRLWPPFIIGAFAALHLVRRRANARFISLLHAAHYLICTECGTGLDGGERTGMCPGCGAPFDSREVQTRWKAIADGLQRSETGETSVAK